MGLPLALIASCQWVVLLGTTWAAAVMAGAGGPVHCLSLRAMETNGGPGLLLPRHSISQLGLGWTCWSYATVSSTSSTAEFWSTFNSYTSYVVQIIVENVHHLHVGRKKKGVNIYYKNIITILTGNNTLGICYELATLKSDKNILEVLYNGIMDSPWKIHKKQ